MENSLYVRNILQKLIDSKEPTQIVPAAAPEYFEHGGRLPVSGMEDSDFENYIDQVKSNIYAAYDANDLPRMSLEFGLLEAAGSHALSEPRRSAYDTYLATGCIPVGHACKDRFMVDEAYYVAEEVFDILIKKRCRRAKLGLEYRPDSLRWTQLYTLIAELKWLGPEEFRNRMMIPNAVVAGYMDLKDRCLSTGNTALVNEEVRARLMNIVGWLGLGIIKMVTRFMPQEAPQLIDDFNNTHGTVLSPKIGQFLESEPLAARNVWYWDYELYKWCMLGPASKEELEWCFQWRLDAYRFVLAPHSSNDSYRLGTRRELEYMLQKRGKLEAYRNAS
ncbi:hypothetical protein IT575_05515 [bacterium]|nr:hypothetical protein [bacterium]